MPVLVLSILEAAGAPKEIVVPLDERLLVHLETTAEHLAAEEQKDPALKKDFAACADDEKIEGETPAALSASMAARHPRLAAALAHEGWKPADFYLAYGTLATMPLASELSRGGEPDTTPGVRQNVAFYDHHKDRVNSLLEKLGRLMGAARPQG